jgi:hypothetical protein
MSLKTIGDDFIKITGNTGTITNPLTLSGSISLPYTTNFNGTLLQTSINAKAPILNPTFRGTVDFENLEIDNVPFNTVVANGGTGATASTITIGNAFIVSGDIYSIQLPFSASVSLPYTANIVVNEISGTAMTVVITDYSQCSAFTPVYIPFT